MKKTKNTIRFFEEIASNGHVALKSLLYDGWLLRFSNGYTNRANSVLPLYSSKKSLEEKVAYCERAYEKEGLSPCFKLTEYNQELSDFLAARGYKKTGESDIMLLKKLNSIADKKLYRSCMLAKSPEEWIDDYFRLENITDKKDQETFRQMLSKVMIDTIYCSIFDEAEVVACASAALEEGYALIQNVIVSEDHRGQGFGEKLCRLIITRAQELGAKSAYLQVLQTNEAAKKLYTKLGFEKIYSYWYMKK